MDKEISDIINSDIMDTFREFRNIILLNLILRPLEHCKRVNYIL